MILNPATKHFLYPPVYENVGAPMSRALRRVRIMSSLLGQWKGDVGFPKNSQLGLDFEGHPPVEFMQDLLKQQGIDYPGELKLQSDIPRERLICRVLNSKNELISVTREAPEKILLQALMLGLCTAHLYDPHRPVLWTQTSLTRIVELFEPEGFYA